MFGELYDSISLLFSWRWPKTDGVITGSYSVPSRDGPQVFVTYEFSLGDDGPYTGESAGFGDEVFLNSLVVQPIVVRYKKSDPSVNKADDTGSL